MRKIVLSIILVLLLGSMVSSGSTKFAIESKQDDTLQDVEMNQTDQLQKTNDIVVATPPTTGVLNLNVVFLGFNNSFIDTTFLQQELIPWYAPIDRYPQLYATGASVNDQLQFDVNYTINYQFDFRPATEVQEYIDFLNANANSGVLGFEWPYYYQTSYQSANYIRADAAEQYLANKYNDGTNPTLVVIDTYSQYRSTFNPYYYNNSYGGVDFPSFLGRKYSALSQVGGGGHDSRLLFVDYSAGPNTYYEAYNQDDHNGVYTYDFTIQSNIDLFNAQVEQAIQSAIEFKFLPSYLYAPVVPNPNQDVVFEFVPVNFEKLNSFTGFEMVPTSNYNMLDAFNPDIFIQQFREMNPDILWRYRFNNEWDWTLDASFSSLVQSTTTITDANSGSIDGYSLMSYLDGYYQSLFNASSSDEYIMPVFLWFLPGQYSTDFGGIAHGDANGVFRYIINAVTHDYAVAKQVKRNWKNNYLLNASSAPSNDYGYVGTYASYFSGEIIQTTVELKSGTSATLEIMDAIELRKYLNSQSYTSLYTLNMNSVTTYSPFNITGADAFTVYFWVLTNTAGTGWANTSITIDRYYTIESGFTRVGIHEGGHGIGISHPHDGFSWELRNDPNTSVSGAYVDWLWDFSDTPMTYSSEVPVFSPMDQDTYRRAILPDYFKMVQQNLTDLLATIDQLHDYIPPSVIDYVVAASGNLSTSIDEFQLWSYGDSLHHIFQAYHAIETAYVQLQTSTADIVISIYGIEYLPEGDNVIVEVGFARGQNRTFTLTNNDSVAINGVIYTDMVVRLIHSNGTVLDTFEGTTQLFITLTAPNGTYPAPNTSTSTSTSDTSTTSTTPSTSDTGTSSTSSSKDTDQSSSSNPSILSLSWGIFILPLSIVLVTSYKERRR